MTMTEALREAEHVHGTNVLLSDDVPKGVEAQGAPSVQEVGAPGKCLACVRTGHYVRDCRLLKAYKQKVGWKGGASPGRIAKHKGPRDKRTQSRRGHPGSKRKMFRKRRAEVAEVGKDEDDYVDPEGDTDEEAWASEMTDSHDEEEASGPGKRMRPGIRETTSPRPHDQGQNKRTVAVDNVEITEKHHNNQRFKHYLPMEIKGHQCGVVVDSGNRWRNIMSEDFATRIGIRASDLRPLQQNTRVMSVRAGADLHVLGEPKEPLVMKLKHNGKTYTTQPAIIRGMHSAFNLSGPWLKTMGWDDLHSQGCLRIDGSPCP